MSNLKRLDSAVYIKIIDLYDYYVFAKVDPYKYMNDSVMNYAINIYKQLDISASVIDTNIKVTEKVFDEIKEISGKYIRIENNLMPEDIIEDIKQFLEYKKLTTKLEGIRKSSFIEDKQTKNNLPTYPQFDQPPVQTVKLESFNEVIRSYSYLCDDSIMNSTKYFIL